MIKIMPYGDHALLVQFSQEINVEIHRKVKALSELAGKLKGVQYYIPAYCSITIVFDPSLTSYSLLEKEIQEMDLKNDSEIIPGKHFRIPVCYEEEFGPDISEVAEFTRLSPKEIVEHHTSVSYHVFMIGFIPGFPYLGKLPNILSCKRKDHPRKEVAAGSVGLAGKQTGIYPAKAPGGWQLIGRTPVPLFQAKNKYPFLIQMGDLITFYSISGEEYHTIEKKFELGELKGKDFYA
ncbi:5-oxoprolinase subunit PxpB [Marivirga sp. S37H4]|uniref:5-oxoprolinase subunit PxpB n=1 Tax=Marivirga aurantiaca TaxID=2802615 RepID=A0A935CA62_9BACT|nr:5-oxoprolinase subunit PxpB [Marivirga aurantiaca]MBK6266410.1 5-oxoprolinase subunit PxpB [Marivirga aurantiaca]